MNLSCFKAYDIRGKLISQLSEPIAYRIGKAFAEQMKAREVVIGGDARLTSEPLKLALAAGLIDGGASVKDIGACGTEEIYFATSHLDTDGGIVVTASHNPIDYNGMKLVKKNSQPISGDTGLFDIQKSAESYDKSEIDKGLIKYAEKLISDESFEQGNASVKIDALLASGKYQQVSVMQAYVEHMLSYVDCTKLSPLKLVVNAGNGAAGKALDAIEVGLKNAGADITFIKVHHQPDGTFPNGIPNPLLPENRADTAKAVIENNADMGIAWDGDFDRCFLFDERGEFIEGYYIVGLLAQAFLAKEQGAKIIYDPRVYWNTEDVILESGGTPIKNKTGHAFIKERMRAEDAVYGGEMSAHHYFREFAYCDSGMIPWLLVAELIASQKTPLSSMVQARINAFPSSGEINSKLKDPDAAIERILAYFETTATDIEYIDGIGVSFEDWRFNLRKSNTEPVIRLNVESKNNPELTQEMSELLLDMINKETNSETV